MPVAPGKRSHALRNVAIGLLLLGAAAFLFTRLNDRVSFKQDVLTPSVFTVKAASMSSFHFTVDRPAHVFGRFQATGGDGNDIEAVIADAGNFEKWKNGQPAQVMYQSDKVTMGSIQVMLSPGQYDLAFNNRFSSLADKTITASIVLNH
jgi:hypothetical protein